MIGFVVYWPSGERLCFVPCHPCHPPPLPTASIVASLDSGILL